MNLYDSENDSVLLYMIYQMDEESLETMLDKYYVYSVKLLKCYLYHQEYEMFGEDCLKDIQTVILKAIYGYRYDRRASFMTYYHKMFYYRILNYRRRLLSYKGIMERSLVSLDNFVNKESSDTFMDFMVNDDVTLEGSYTLHKEEYRYVLKRLLFDLRPDEQQAVIMHQDGYSYRDIAETLHMNQRHVEYVIMKVRKSKALID